ncbi:MAG: radical SAM family heme chaperone HemW [Lachnospiraceae bacterium]|nr:radical SAM family heme chaperone HemW [Lachnospiraceae bacterium]
MPTKELGIYIHIPFCVRKCAYCDFLSFPCTETVREQYVCQLLREIRAFDPVGYQGVSIFFGGGTPSILEADQIGRILAAVRECFELAEDVEITIECNPGTLTKGKLEAYRSFGINRLSLGLQSAEDADLRCLGRIHSYRQFEENYHAAREAGFTNINVDLMSAIPGQTPESWETGLKKVLALKPEHISAYSLIIEEGTPFYEKYEADHEARQRGETPQFLPSEEDERTMYHTTLRLLKEAGLERYEISNYAWPGFESRHNSGYWIRRDYVGFGLGASSLLGNCRMKNTEELEEYLELPFAENQPGIERTLLTRSECMEETMFLGLRLCRGVDPKRFEDAFGETLMDVYGPVVEKLLKEELLWWTEEGTLALTERGMDLANYVMAQFLLE